MSVAPDAREADPDTRNTYSQTLAEENSTRYDGRVWTDKTVTAGNVEFTGDAGDQTIEISEDGEFLVTYSALATSTSITGRSSVPVDVTFIVDLSGSMGNGSSGMEDGRSRIAHVVDALNTAMETLMAQNPSNRVAVIGYSSTSTSLLPLGHYEKVTNWYGEEQDYFSLNQDEPSDRRTAELTVRAHNTATDRDVDTTRSVSGGTNIQMGVYTGMNALATAEETTVEINGQTVNRVPRVVLLSDGAATFSSSSRSWWAPDNNSNNGPGGSSYYGNGMKAMLTASYMKEAIDRHYNPANDDYAVQVYTMGIGTSRLSNTDDVNLSNITLNPKDHWNDNNSMANSVRNAWGQYTRQGGSDNTPDIQVDSGRDGYYTVNHPQQNDITNVGLQYNNAYYDAVTADDIRDMFEEIVSSAAVSAPQVPTQISNEGPFESGWLNYSDTIGEYMQVNNVPAILYGGQRIDLFDTEDVADGIIYHFTGTISSPVYGELDASNIDVKVTDNADGTQTLTVDVPAAAIPLRVNTVDLDSDGSVTSNEDNNAMPLRVVYEVGMKDGTVDANNNLIIGEGGVSQDYVTSNTDENNQVAFYSNAFSGKNVNGDDATMGDATTTFTPATTNPFYYVTQDTTLYTDPQCTNPAKATRYVEAGWVGGSPWEGGHWEEAHYEQIDFDPNAPYYYQIEYYEGDQIQTDTVALTGSQIVEYVKEVETGVNGESVWTLEANTPRFDHLNDFAQAKTDNATGTAAQRLQSQMAGGQVTQYEGNNGKLTLPLPASLTISKNVTAADGLTAPNAEFNFTITAQAKANETVNAVKTTSGADPATSTVQITFNGEGKANFTLTAGESIEFPGMTNTEYTVVETPAAGFTNTGATVSPADAGTHDNAQHSVAGTVGTVDASIAFTNNYSVTAIDQTPADLGLTLIKTISNRDFEQDDSFSFTISASQATQNAPLPAEPTITVNPTEGTSVNATFTNNNAFHFTQPSGSDGFRYIIRENATTSHGVSIDSAVYRLTVHVNDNGQGQLVVDDEATTLEKWDNQNNAWVTVDNMTATFNNTYSATDDVVAFAGTKTLSGRTMTATDSFSFTVEADGSRELNSTDEFTEDADQPMPTSATAVATQAGTITFGDMTFDENDINKEYRYVITENVPAGVQDADGNSDNGFQYNGITYDLAQKVVIVKVKSEQGTDGDAVRATVCDESGTPITSGSDFTVNNEYHATGELDGSTNLQVSKTLTGRAWGENETFTFGLEGGDGAPMPQGAIGNVSTVTLNKDNQSGAFGNIAFDEEDLSDGNGGYLQEKTFNYTITENGMDDKGLHYSEAEYKVAVTVTNNGDGTLGVSSVMTKTADDEGNAINPGTTVEGNVAAFTNTYTSSFEGSGVSLNGTKVLTNTKWPTGVTLGQNDFRFHTEAQNGAPIGTGGVNRNNAEGAETDTPGVFKAPIYGLLQQVTIDQSNMVGEEGNPVATKDFQYIITEYNHHGVGYTYDESQYRVTITATDDQQGKITAAISKIEKRASEDAEWSEIWTTNSDTSVNDVIVFNNSYAPSDATLTSTDLGLTKQLTGNRSTALAEDEFTFTMSVTAADGSDVDSVTLPNPATVGNAADDTAENGVYSGAIDFGDIVFTRAGTFTIHVKENMPDDATENGDGTWTYNGVTGNSAQHTFTYKVEDKSGRLVATLDDAQSSGGATFTNEYSATASQPLDGVKNIVGRDFEEGDTFTFQVKGTAVAADGATAIQAPKPSGVSDDNWQLTINPTSGDTATLGFGTVTFTQPGVYTYTFSEYEGELGGMTYDTGERTVVFTVTDTGTGVLNVEVTQGDLTNATTWTNRYQPQGEESYATTGLNGTKTFTGRNMLENESFEFALDPATDDADATGQNASTADLVKDKFITLDATSDTVTGLKNADGSNTGSFDFGNITVTPQEGFSGVGTFTFYVHEVLPDGVDAENNTLYGITYDTHVGTLTLVVTDTDEDGKHTGELTITPQFDDGDFAFENSYNAEPATFSVDADSAFTKVLTGRDWTAGDVFTFRLTTTPGNPLPSGGEAPADVPNAKDVTLNADGALAGTAEDGQVAIDFGEFEFDYADMAGATVDQTTGLRTKTFTYNISELNPSIAGVTQSSASYQLAITVQDDNNGKLEIAGSTITRTANDAGVEESTQLGDSEKAVFTNTYLAGNDVETFRGTKSYTDTTADGDQLKSNMFAFMLTAVGGTDAQGDPIDAANVPMPVEMPDGVQDLDEDPLTFTVYNNTSNFNFPGITYTQDDDGNTYNYKVVEAVQDADGIWKPVTEAATQNNKGQYVINGMIYDASEKTIKVEVTTDTTTDPGVAQIVATTTFDQGSLNFTNTYEPTSATLEGDTALHGTKTVDGRNILNGETFDFVLMPINDAAQQAVNNGWISIEGDWSNTSTSTASTPAGNGNSNTADFAFEKMTFNHVTDGDGYQFAIIEVLPDGVSQYDPVKDGLTYDRHQTNVTITVTDNGDGTLKAEATYDNTTGVTEADKAKTTKAAFTNVYEAAPVEGVPADFALTKVFEGHAWTDAYSFQFMLTPVDAAPMPKADEANGVTIDESGNAIKTVTGPQDSGKATFDFGAITYSQPGEYHYAVSEVPGENPGIDWSGNVARVTVTVTDNGNGTLSASASIDNSTFTNTYKTGEVEFDAAAGLQVVKNMTGRAIGAGDFTFTMTGEDDASIARLNNGKPLEFSTTGADLGNTGDSNVASEVIPALTGLTFTQEDVDSTYTYTVTETNGGQTIDGVTYDDTSYEVKFVVTEDGEGTLLVETFVDGVRQGVTQGAIATNALPAQLEFDNSYDADSTTVGAQSEATIEGTKTLANDDIANYNFTFTVKGENGAEVATGSNNGTETITFGDIVYTTENLNAAVTAEGSDEVGKATKVENADGTTTYTFKYTVSEDAPSADSGVAANSASQGVTVTVTDNGTGQLSASVSYDDGDALAFENTYGGDASFKLGIAGNKVIASADGLNKPELKGGEYEFTIVGNKAEDGTLAPMPDATTVTNGASGIVNFGPIEYTMENVFGADATALDVDATADEGVETLKAGRTKVFTYTISESGTLPGVTNEQGTKTVEVTVYDLGGGKIEAKVTSQKTASDTDFTFTNTYNVTPEDSSLTGEGGFSITKKLTANTGRTLANGEFEFVLTDVATGNVVARATNTADGVVEFPAMTFDKPGAYKYELSEVPGNAAGVTYDADKYNVTANVKDNGDGTLAVEWTIEGVDAGGTVAFENAYEADPTSITFGALKTLTGRDMVEGEFTFELTDPDGNIVTATNGANGSVVFPTVEFTEEGTFEYMVSEALPADDDPNTEGVQKDGVTYDEKVWTATVNVVDNPETGVLEATVDYGNDGKLAEFHNTYVEPEEPVAPAPEEPADEPDGPKFAQTNDSTPWMLIAGIAVVAAALVAVGAFGLLRTRRR